MLKVRREEDAVIPVQMDLTPIDGWEDIDFAIRRGRLTGKHSKLQLSDRQKKIITQIQTNGSITSRWCQDSFKISRETANQDFSMLIELKIIRKIGKGRATRYEFLSESSGVK